MRTRTTILIAAAAVIVCAAGGVGLALATAPGSAPGITTASAPGTGDGTADAAAPGTGGDAGQAASGADPGTGTASPRPFDGEQGYPTATPYALPSPTALPRILTGEVPASASASGKVVKGFPESIPAAPKSKVASSSLASEDSRVQVSLTASTSLGLDEVLAFYRTAFAKYGLYDSPAPATGGQTAVAFTRDDDSITLAITPTDDGVDYVVYAALTAHA